MQSLFKRLSVAALAVSTGVAIAATIANVDAVNERVAKLLAPFNTDTTQARVVFKALDIDAVRALRFGVSGLLTKTGTRNQVRIEVPNVDYVYEGAEGLPTFDAALKIDFDFLKSFPQEFLDEAAKGAEPMIKDLVAGLVREYGEAATIDAKIDELLKDENDHVQSIRLHIQVDVDFSKLPEHVPLKDVPLRHVRLETGLGLSGAQVSVRGQLNPKYSGFEQDQRGFKELIEGLINEDKATYEDLQGLVTMLDRAADHLVNRSPDDRLLRK